MKRCRDLYLQRHKARRDAQSERFILNSLYTINNHTTEHTALGLVYPGSSVHATMEKKGKKGKKTSDCFFLLWDPPGHAAPVCGPIGLVSGDVRFPTCFGYAMWTMGSYGGLAVLLDEKEYFIENYILNAREYLLQEIPNMLDCISANSGHSLAVSVFSLSLSRSSRACRAERRCSQL